MATRKPKEETPVEEETTKIVTVGDYLRNRKAQRAAADSDAAPAEPPAE